MQMGKQYQSVEHIFVEAQERARARTGFCGLVNVLPHKDASVGGIIHSASVTHVCTMPYEHTGACICECGSSWRGK